MDLVVAAIIFAFGALVAYASHRLGSSWGTDGPQSGYFPFYIGLLICISGIMVFVQGLLRLKSDTKIFVNNAQFKLVLLVLLPALAYVLGIQLIGIYVTSALYIATFMVMLGKYSWFKASVLAVMVNVCLFLMFEVWFKLPLYKGQWNPLAFLGY